MLICPRSLSAGRLLGEKAPAKSEGPPRSRDLGVARGEIPPRSPARAEQVEGRTQTERQRHWCHQRSLRSPAWHQQGPIQAPWGGSGGDASQRSPDAAVARSARAVKAGGDAGSAPRLRGRGRGHQRAEQPCPARALAW